MKKQSWFSQETILIGVLSFIVSALFWWMQIMEANFAAKLPDIAHLPLIEADGATAYRYAHSGIRESQLTATNIRYLSNDQGSFLQEPRWQLFELDGKTIRWQGSSEQGELNADHSILKLLGTVNLSFASKDQPIAVVTRDVTLYSESKTAETEQPIAFTFPNGHMTGQGATVWLQNEKIKLHQQVIGEYNAKAPR